MPTVTVELDHWALDDPAAMAACLNEMYGNGFHGSVWVNPEPTPPEPPEDWVAQPVWRLDLNDTVHRERPTVQGLIGQVVVFFGGVLQVMSADEFAAQFGEAP